MGLATRLAVGQGVHWACRACGASAISSGWAEGTTRMDFRKVPASVAASCRKEGWFSKARVMNNCLTDKAGVTDNCWSRPGLASCNCLTRPGSGPRVGLGSGQKIKKPG